MGVECKLIIEAKKKSWPINLTKNLYLINLIILFKKKNRKRSTNDK